jgi:hypothetical protein
MDVPKSANQRLPFQPGPLTGKTSKQANNTDTFLSFGINHPEAPDRLDAGRAIREFSIL